MNWLLIIVGIIFLICMIVGYVRGFIKIVVSLAATIATIALVVVMTPYVSEGIASVTPIDEMIQKKCASTMKPNLKDIDLTGTPLEGVDLESAGITLEDIQKQIGDVEIPRQKQVELLEASGLPPFLRDGLIENNNSEAYNRLHVSKFPEYVGAYLADVIIKMISFLLTFIIATIVIRAVIFALDIVTALPVIKGLNRIAGIGIGMLIAVIIVWIGFFAITLLYDTIVGKDCFMWIQESKLLTFLYNENIIMKLATKL